MSEFTIIKNYFQVMTKRHKNTICGIGDDGAVSDVPSDCELVSCVDTLVLGRHFPMTTSAYAIGYKSVAVNLSDLAAMAATPYAILLGLSLPAKLACDEWLGEFARGIGGICREFGVELIGGDTTRSDVLTVSVTALGFVHKGRAITRAGAKVGDVVCVSGEIGSASYALSQVLIDKPTAWQHTLDLPIPQVTLGEVLRDYASAMIDVSDGLGQDLGHILTASGVGASIELDKIPCIDELKVLPDNQKWQHILNGGDDYQLCFTLSEENFKRLNSINPYAIFAIGKIVDGQGIELFHKGKLIEFEIQGWEHFK